MRTKRNILIFLIAIIVVGSSGGYYVLSHTYTPHIVRKQLPSVTPTFQPVVGDVADPEHDDPDITVQQPLIPGFQFQHGGYTLRGAVLDAQSRQPIGNAVVWLDLPVHVGQPTSIALHTVTDAQGQYQFSHIAVGVYTLVASRYYNVGDGHYYAERVFPAIPLNANRDNVLLLLKQVSAPGKRVVSSGQAKNLILIDLRGFYVNSLLDDPLLTEQTQNMRSFLQRASVARSLWQPYGWRPLDQYALLTGTYPQWATYDSWPQPVPWGQVDHIDTTFWFTGGRSAHLFGQESIFDVAKGYGMQTSVVASADYVLSDATTRNLDLLQRTSAFLSNRWLNQMETTVQSGTHNPNGFLLYGELAPLPTSDVVSSPDAQNDEYQQALLSADQTFGMFLHWLETQGLLNNTLIALTTSQAQANHSDADNFYGMGATGQGTSKQTLLALSGPGVCSGQSYDTPSSSFVIAPTLLHTLGLPAPQEARIPVPVGGCS